MGYQSEEYFKVRHRNHIENFKHPSASQLKLGVVKRSLIAMLEEIEKESPGVGLSISALKSNFHLRFGWFLDEAEYGYKRLSHLLKDPAFSGCWRVEEQDCELRLMVGTSEVRESFTKAPPPPVWLEGGPTDIKRAPEFGQIYPSKT